MASNHEYAEASETSFCTRGLDRLSGLLKVTQQMKARATRRAELVTVAKQLCPQCPKMDQGLGGPAVAQGYPSGRGTCAQPRDPALGLLRLWPIM